MSENIENIRIDELLEENNQLRARNEFLERCVKALRLNNAQTTKERNEFIERNIELQKELCDIKSMSMFEFGNTYCSSESLEKDGHALAKALLGGK